MRPAGAPAGRLREVLLTEPPPASAWPLRRALAPAGVALLFALSLALRAGASDGFRFLTLPEAGDRYAHPGAELPGERIVHGNGYDGQFSMALAQDPLLTRQDTARSLDNTFRVRRILYPLLAWALALGRRSAVPYSLVAINIVATAALAALLALAAVRGGRSPWWSLAVIAYPGVWFPILLDLTEPLQLALLAAGVLAESAGLLFLAALAKETAGVALATEAVRAALERRWRRAGVHVALGALFLAWSLFVYLTVRGPAFNTLGAHFLDPPGAPLIAMSRGGAGALVILPALAVAVLALIRPIWFRDAAAWSAAAYALVVLGAGLDTWADPAAYFRVTAGAGVLAYISWTRTGDRLGLLTFAAGLVGALIALPAIVTG